jgi:hypothetical protein
MAWGRPSVTEMIVQAKRESEPRLARRSSTACGQQRIDGYVERVDEENAGRRMDAHAQYSMSTGRPLVFMF